MNKDTLERLRETVLVPHGDPQLVLYTKLVVGLLWLVHLPLGFLYGAPLPVLSSAGRHDASGRRQPLSVPPQCQPGAGAGCSAGVSGRQRPAFPEGLCGLFQLVFPADILLFLHLRAGPRGRHFYQPSGLSLGDGLPARRAHPRPRRPLRRELRAPFPVPLHLHPRGGLYHHVLHPALLGGPRPNAIFYCSSASTRRRANSRRCR